MERASLARPTLSVWYFPERRSRSAKYQKLKVDLASGDFPQLGAPSWFLDSGSFLELLRSFPYLRPLALWRKNRLFK